MVIDCPPIVRGDLCSRIQRLQEFLHQHPDKNHLFDILHSYFVLHRDMEEGESDITIDYEKRFRRIIEYSEYNQDLSSLSEIKSGINRTKNRWWLYAAAIVCIVSLASLSIFYIQKQKIIVGNNAVKTNEIVSRSGARTKLMLSDGSQVWLNSGSKLNYSGDYNKTLREVDLEGEAYFDVAKDAERSFYCSCIILKYKSGGNCICCKILPAG